MRNHFYYRKEIDITHENKEKSDQKLHDLWKKATAMFRKKRFDESKILYETYIKANPLNMEAKGQYVSRKYRTLAKFTPYSYFSYVFWYCFMFIFANVHFYPSFFTVTSYLPFTMPLTYLFVIQPCLKLGFARSFSTFFCIAVCFF